MPFSILFVDDENDRPTDDTESYMWNYGSACKEVGFDVHEASGVDEALKVLRAHPDISIVVTDLLMPRGALLESRVSNEFETGVAFAAHLQKHFPSLILLVLTNAQALGNINKLRKLSSVKRVLFKAETTPSEFASILMQAIGIDQAPVTASSGHSPDSWRSLLNGKKQKAFSTFLANPSKLTTADFFLLSEVNHDLMRQLMAGLTADTILDSSWSTATLQQLLCQIETATNSLEKGKHLEELVARLFETIPGFSVKTRVRSRTEEFDIYILNGSERPPWRDMGPALLGECKKWNERSGAKEYRDFAGKMQTKRGQCKCGFFISWSGFTKAFVEEDLRSSKEQFLILRLERKHLRGAVALGDFQSLLTNLWHEALQT